MMRRESRREKREEEREGARGGVDLGVLDDGSRYRDPLLLTSAQLDSSFPYPRPVPLRQMQDELVRVGDPSSLPDLLLQPLPALCSLLEEAMVVAVEDVALDAPRKQHRLLPHQRKHSMQPSVLQLTDLHVVQADAAGGGLVEVLEEVEDGALARS